MKNKLVTGDLVKIMVKCQSETYLNGKIGLYLSKSKYPYDKLTNEVLLDNEVFMFTSKELDRIG